MNLLQLETYVANFLQVATDFTNGNWSKAQVDQYLFDGEMRVFTAVAAQHEDFFWATSTLSETANVATVNLPVNCYRIMDMERIVGGSASTSSPMQMTKLDRTPEARNIARAASTLMGPSSATSYSMYYMSHGQKMVELVPAPTVTVANSLLLTYCFSPIGMAAPTDVPFQAVAGTGGAGKDNLPEWHDLIAKFAIYSCLNQEESFPQADRVMSEIQKRERELLTFLASTNVQAPAGIQVTAAELDCL